ANALGWNRTNVTVTFTCLDDLSGVASCTTPATVTAEGAGQVVLGTAQDNAGNSATDPAQVNLDKSAPTITASRAPAANGFGWSKADVVVSFACTDALSGVAICPDAVTLAEGAGQSASGTALDAAGNSAAATLSGINVDKSAP